MRNKVTNLQSLKRTKERRSQMIVARDDNFSNVKEMVAGKVVFDDETKNRIAEKGYKLNRYGIRKEGKLIASNESDIIRLLDTEGER